MEIVKGSVLERPLSAAVEQTSGSALLVGVRFEVAPENVAAARALVRLRLEYEVTPGQAVDTATLIVSELATNVVKYHDWDMEPAMLVALIRDDSTLRIEVHDTDPHVPRQRTPDLMSEGGRGLVVVEMLSERWGVGRTAEGKFVWAEFTAWPDGADA